MILSRGLPYREATAMLSFLLLGEAPAAASSPQPLVPGERQCNAPIAEPITDELDADGRPRWSRFYSVKDVCLAIRPEPCRVLMGGAAQVPCGAARAEDRRAKNSRRSALAFLVRESLRFSLALLKPRWRRH